MNKPVELDADDVQKESRGYSTRALAGIAMSKTRMISEYEYKCTTPKLPANATSPVMDYKQMTDWLNTMAKQGWEFVGCGATHWTNGTIQDWWIFRRKVKP
jgi:hypothetical protein